MTADVTERPEDPTGQPAGPDQARPSMSDGDDVARLMQLLHKADSVELKVTVPTDAQLSTIRSLPIDPIAAQTRQVFFFDTPDLDLDHAGVVVRARRSQGGRGDTVIKLRPVVPDELSPELRRLGGFNIEVDVLPGGYMCSASLKGRATVEEVKDAVQGRLKLSRLFAKDQRAFFTEHAPADIELDNLSVLGPTFVLKTAWDADVSDFGRTDVQRMVAELWLYPDGSRILELSLRCPMSAAFQAAAEARAYLAAHGVHMGGEQQTKTRAALQFYSAQLHAKAQ